MEMEIEFLLAFVAAVSLCGYFPLDRMKARYADVETPLDRTIPLMPLFIFPYLGFFLYVGLAFAVLVFSPYAKSYFVSLIIAALIADVFWYVWPIRVKRSPLTGSSISLRLINLMRRYNKPGNAFPSSHVFVSLITGYWLCTAFPLYALFGAVCAALIVLSTVLIKQHYIVDVLGGFVLAATAIYLANTILVMFP